MALENKVEAGKGSENFTQNDLTVDQVTGFGAAANQYMEKGIDLNEHLTRNKAATFFMRMNSEAMTDAGIFPGDLIIIDRSIKAVSGKVVIAVLHDELLIRRYEKTFNRVRLIPETSRLSPIDIDPSCDDFTIWGVVTYVIHSL